MESLSHFFFFFFFFVYPLSHVCVFLNFFFRFAPSSFLFYLSRDRH